ncbi:hypothetical protein [Paractinoplanes atraurantiacus]|uniref:Uncharacterized protein n=1 Tax=Paractinoplanes atraurantiacus TaxID=1036182 RepID=A0A285K483_9ACTN|nr:hypothetical protein [Actinoplanes atraurantiacus]SNY67374.1 hypothetical protein SAMN05421748_13197 [Actinoplanes atraurantiacus]
MRRNVRRLLSGLAATATAVGLATTLGATPALAQSDGSAYTKAWISKGYVAHAGYVYFTALGEKFTLFDSDADGAGVSVQYYVNGAYREELYLGSGNGTDKTFDRSFAEGAAIRFRVCLIDNDVIQETTCAWGSGVA